MSDVSTHDPLAKLRYYAEHTDSGDRDDLLKLFAALDDLRKQLEASQEKVADITRREVDLINALIGMSRRERDTQSRMAAMTAQLSTERRAGYDEADAAVGRARAEFDDLVAALGFVIEGRDGRGSAPIYVRHGVKVRAGGYEGWVTSCCNAVGHQHDTLPAALAHVVDPWSWARPDTWAVRDGIDGPLYAIKLRSAAADHGPLCWKSTSMDGEDFVRSIYGRRPATQEESERFDAESVSSILDDLTPERREAALARLREKGLIPMNDLTPERREAALARLREKGLIPMNEEKKDE